MTVSYEPVSMLLSKTQWLLVTQLYPSEKERISGLCKFGGAAPQVRLNIQRAMLHMPGLQHSQKTSSLINIEYSERLRAFHLNSLSCRADKLNQFY